MPLVYLPQTSKSFNQTGKIISILVLTSVGFNLWQEYYSVPQSVIAGDSYPAAIGMVFRSACIHASYLPAAIGRTKPLSKFSDLGSTELLCWVGPQILCGLLGCCSGCPPDAVKTEEDKGYQILVRDVHVLLRVGAASDTGMFSLIILLQNHEMCGYVRIFIL